MRVPGLDELGLQPVEQGLGQPAPGPLTDTGQRATERAARGLGLGRPAKRLSRAWDGLALRPHQKAPTAPTTASAARMTTMFMFCSLSLSWGQAVMLLTTRRIMLLPITSNRTADGQRYDAGAVEHGIEVLRAGAS